MITHIISTMDFCAVCRLYRQTFEESGQQLCICHSSKRYHTDELFIVYSKAKWWLISFDGMSHIHVQTQSKEYSDIIDFVGDGDATALIFR